MRRAIPFLVMMVLGAFCATSQCAQKVAMASYSVCVPNGWQVFPKKSLDQVMACSKAHGECTMTGGGFPRKNVVVITITPTEKLPEGDKNRNIEDIVKSAPHAGKPARPVSDVPVGNGAPGRRCLVARTLMPALGFWDELYGLEVNGRLFTVSAQYQDEDKPEKIDAYRKTVQDILSTVVVVDALRQ
jgi:hypothetical protein